MQVRYRFLMDGDDVGTGLGKVGDIEIRILDHQVHIKRLGGDFTQGVDHQRTDSNVGNKVTVHDIDVNVIGAGTVYSLNVFPETGKISGKNRWGYLDHLQLRSKVNPL